MKTNVVESEERRIKNYKTKEQQRQFYQEQ